MNREIEFRAWDGEEMIILKNSGLQYYDFEGSYSLGFTVDAYSDFWAHEQYENATKKANTFPLMQFTGLTDKNGVKIFEGDLLNIGSDVFGFVTNMNNELVTYEVKHETTDFILYRHDIKLKWGRLSRLEEMLWNCQIIGNIYENKNLIL
jgi:uncharacterized phage protein (TIGR01671 family)